MPFLKMKLPLFFLILTGDSCFYAKKSRHTEKGMTALSQAIAAILNTKAMYQ